MKLTATPRTQAFRLLTALIASLALAACANQAEPAKKLLGDVEACIFIDWPTKHVRVKWRMVVSLDRQILSKNVLHMKQRVTSCRAVLGGSVCLPPPMDSFGVEPVDNAHGKAEILLRRHERVRAHLIAFRVTAK